MTELKDEKSLICSTDPSKSLACIRFSMQEYLEEGGLKQINEYDSLGKYLCSSIAASPNVGIRVFREFHEIAKRKDKKCYYFSTAFPYMETILTDGTCNPYHLVRCPHGTSVKTFMPNWNYYMIIPYPDTPDKAVEYLKNLLSKEKLLITSFNDEKYKFECKMQPCDLLDFSCKRHFNNDQSFIHHIEPYCIDVPPFTLEKRK